MEPTTKKTSRPEAIHWNITVHADYLEDKETLDPNGTPLEEKEAWFNKSHMFKYAVFGREICPKTGKKHLQGYVALHKKMYLTGVKKLFPRAHCEICQGNPEQNRKYCTKVSDYL